MPLVHGYVPGAILMHDSYFLETLAWQGTHVYGKDLETPHKQWRDTPNTPASFATWLAIQNRPCATLPYPLRPITYLPLSAARRHDITAVDGKLHYMTSPAYPRTPVSTPWGAALVVVITTTGKLRAINYVMSSQHHSTLVQGAPVTAAGEIITDAFGRLKEITDKSGHYRTGPQCHWRLLDYLRSIGAIDAVREVVFRRNSWLPKSEVFNAWEHLQILDKTYAHLPTGVVVA